MGGHFDISNKKKRLSELNNKVKDSSFWDDNNSANEIMKDISFLNKEISVYDSLDKELSNDFEMLDMLKDDYNEELANDYLNDLDKLQSKIEELEINTLLNGEYDNYNCYLEIHPGAGGTESCDWADMLLRMYQRFCDKNGYKYEVMEKQPGDEAGIKSVTMLIKGDFAYGYFKCERGVHRLVRISPFDSNKRRHTSFASISVVPEIDQNVNVEINDDDIRIDTYCASGHGGQGVNTTPSAVRITHFPTHIVVTCQNERSQIQNKEQAMKVLKSKLFLLEQEKKEKEMKDLKGAISDINFGSQVRSYVLEPYTMVKDNRSNYECSDANRVLDGDIKPFMESILKM